tara:strand:+ start:582 stop:1208 length:627 start_codon:yes stop_codon:yes gene_type:complete
MALVKLNNNGVKNATAFGSITGLGNLKLIKKQTASSSASVSFVDGASSVVLDNTYKEYIFYFNNIHPATNAAKFRFVGSTNTGSSYGVATTTTMFEAMQDENGSNETLRYEDGDDAAQSTNPLNITTGISGANDGCVSGFFHLFEPSSSTFAKHFISTMQFMNGSGTPYCVQNRTAGYINSTSAVDAIQFSFASGNIDAGTISLYGVA